MQARLGRLLYFSAACLSGLTSLYCLLWIISSASLASGYCHNNFSLFAAEFRCRQPQIAMILTAIFGALCVYLFWRGARAGRRSAP